MTARKNTNRKSKPSAARKRQQAQKRSGEWNFERLERRELLAAITVSNATDILSPTADTTSIVALIASDGGDGISLREAIAAANNTAGEDAVTFDGSVFTGGDNSLIRLTQGELFISDSLTIDASSVGDVVISGDANDDDITITGTHVTDVSASYGVTAGAADDLLDDNSRVINFNADLAANLALTGLTITGGRVPGGIANGGGILFSSGDAFNPSGTLSLNQSAVSGNSTNGLFGSGGGIHVDFGDLSLTSSTVSGNSTAGDGGGINTFYGDVSLTNSTVSGNSAVIGNSFFVSQARGGGIFTTGDLSLTNSTVSGNSSGTDGGGIWSANSRVLLVSSTVTGNSASGAGGGITLLANYDADGITLHNSIVAGNESSDTAQDLSITGDVADDSIVEYSLIGNTSGSGINAASGAGNILNQSALLRPLADNGGPTLTHALLPESPAVNGGNNALALDTNGNPLTNDQRGDARILLGTVDIGAYELGDARSLVVTTKLDVEDPSDGLTSLREAIALANDPTAGVNNDGDVDGDGLKADRITFDFSVFSGAGSSVIRLTQGELVVSNSLTIDSTMVGGVVITGDAADDDITVLGTHVTDVAASFNETVGAANDFLDDNSRVLNFSAASGDLTLTGLTITGGRTTFDSEHGGGIRFNSNGTLTLNQSSVSGNSTLGDSADGGGIYSYSGDLSLTNSTVSGNRSLGELSLGGGIRTIFGNTSLTNSTVSGNSAGLGGGGIHSNAGNVVLYNSIVAGNTSKSSGAHDLERGSAGQNLIVEYSLIGDTTGSGITETSGTGNLLNQAALLGPLADNGGATLTHALLPSSPAINGGSNALALDENGVLLATDQRGENRIKFDTVDIGAFEFEELRSLVVTTNQDVEDPLDGLTSLREAIAFANDPTVGSNDDGDADADGLVADTITFDPDVFTGGDNSLIRLTQGALVVSDSLSIDGSSVGSVVISGDANGNDITLPGTAITDVDASGPLLSDNRQVLNFSSSGSLTLTGLTITGGAYYSGGGGGVSSSGDISLVNSTVSGNVAAYGGGGIRTGSGNVSLVNSTVSNNVSAADGGGIYSDSGVVSLSGSTVSANRTTQGDYSYSSYYSSADGGGIRTNSGDLFLNNSTVSDNSSEGAGGGISIGSGDLFLNNSTVTGNSSVGAGGNGPLGAGGGIASSTGNVSLVNSTVTGNMASTEGGGIRFRGNELVLRNSIIAGNTAILRHPDLSMSSSGVIGDLNNSLIGDTMGSGITAATGIGNVLNQAALLGPLADNGGPTLTHALLPGSPAIDAGSNALAVDENGTPLATDQRGEARVFDGTVDIGSVEFEAPLLLGDANLDGDVNFLDVSPFISLLSSNTFLDEADINRDGEVNFLDISPFISLLSLSGASPATSQSIVVAPPASSLVSAVASEPVSIVSVAPTVAVPVTVETLDAEQVGAEPAKVSPNIATTEPLPQLPLVAPLVLVNDPLAPPADQASNLLVVDTAVAEVTPVDAYSGPVVLAAGKSRSFGDRNLSLRGSESNGPQKNGQLARQRSLAGSEKNLDFSQESNDTHSTADMTIEESFSTAAELFDAHPESLDEVFDFELEEALVGLIE